MGEEAPLPRAGTPGQQDSQAPGLPPQPTGLPSKKDKHQKDTDDNTVRTTGKVLRNDGKLIEIESDDTRILLCKIVAKTQFGGPDGKLTKDDIEPGAHVRLVAIADDQNELTASSVTIENAAEKPKNEKTATIDSVAHEDDGRPVVKRGKPKNKPRSEDEEDDTPLVASTTPVPTSAPANTGSANSAGAHPVAEPESPSETVEKKPAKLIDRTIAANKEFTNRLPNFVCQQITNRYERHNKVDGFRAIDVVTANVTYTDGAEKYDNIKVGNRSVHEGMMDIKNGARSMGEFGSILDGLFSRQTAAEFTFARDEIFHRVATQVYEFKVSHDNSDWPVSQGGETILPAYSGHIWIDKQTARVLRYERSADEIPEAFPLDSVEQSIDFEPVMLGSRKVLLPVESKNLACQRGSAYCTRNLLEWRNYRQFGAESTVDFSK